MNTGIMLAMVVCLIICLVDLRDHNKKVDELFPDHTDPQQFRMYDQLHLNLFGFYFLLIVMIGVLIYCIAGDIR